MGNSGLQMKAGLEGELPDMPLPEGAIIEGECHARGVVLMQSGDRKQSAGLWSCTGGKFNWVSPWWETVRILEGEVTISEEGGPTYTLKAGDFGHVPLGAKTVWTVPEFVKKVFFVVTEDPL